MLLELESASLIQTPVLGERPFPAMPFSELGAKGVHVEGNLQAGCRPKPERNERNRPLAHHPRSLPPRPLKVFAENRTSPPSRSVTFAVAPATAALCHVPFA